MIENRKSQKTAYQSVNPMVIQFFLTHAGYFMKVKNLIKFSPFKILCLWSIGML